MTPENVGSKPPSSPRALNERTGQESPQWWKDEWQCLDGIRTSAVLPRFCKSTKYSSSSSEDRISSNLVRNLSMIYIRKGGVSSPRSPLSLLVWWLPRPWMALCGLVLFVHYLPVGVIIDSKKHQDYILCRTDKLENCPKVEKKREESGSKDQGRPEMVPKGLDFQNCFLAKHRQRVTHVHGWLCGTLPPPSLSLGRVKTKSSKIQSWRSMGHSLSQGDFICVNNNI